MKKTKHFPVSKGKTTFGLHLMLDAYEVDPKLLGDMKRVFRFLNDLPEKIGMKKLTAPMVIDADASATGHDPGGITGTVIIAESHISIHTFANRGFFTMDLYSCTDFEEEISRVLEYTKKMFPYKEHELNIVTRGQKYPIKNLEILDREKDLK